jgi:cytoskeletal protein CcmA (bactofilin family)
MTSQPSYFGKRPAVSLTPRPMGAAPSPAATAVAPAGIVAASSTSTGAPTKEGGSKLTVGPNIKLKGVEITDCDTLVVEGTVEATMDSRVMHITEAGAFKGSAEVDFAEVHGQFQGDLTVRQKLVIYTTGRVIGTIRYGKVIIEEGGQLTGDIQFGASKGSASLTTLAASAATHSNTSAPVVAAPAPVPAIAKPLAPQPALV